MHSYTRKETHNHTMTTLGSICYRTEERHIRSDHKGNSVAAQSDRSQGPQRDSKEE